MGEIIAGVEKRSNPRELRSPLEAGFMGSNPTAACLLYYSSIQITIAA